MMQRTTRALFRELVKEVVIAGEIDIADLYADYRPSDPKEYLGMTPKQSSDAMDVNMPVGGDDEIDDAGKFMDEPLDGASSNAEESV